MRRSRFSHEFVEFIPVDLEEGTLYVSMPYATAVHKCACGCGNKVVTPISPAQWQLGFDGESVSLTPSIGSWQLPCRSHYWISHDEIRWARPWTEAQVAAGRQRDHEDVEAHHARGTRATIAERAKKPSDTEGRSTLIARLWRRRRGERK